MGKSNGQGGMSAGTAAKGSISATIIRADGSEVKLGKVAHTNRFINALLQLKLRFYRLTGRM